MRKFNTSGPNILDEHYTLSRLDLIETGKELVHTNRYFTIWAPRQTGKSTYFELLTTELEKEGYKVAQINFENYKKSSMKSFIQTLTDELGKYWHKQFPQKNLQSVFQDISNITDEKLVLIFYEVEGINPKFFGDFLHSIRNLYHRRTKHSLKSVILVSVSNIVGVVQDNASPFNIADNLNVPYFTNEETRELLGQHEQETGQLFEDRKSVV